MERSNKRLLINFLLGFATCSLILRAGLMASGLHFYHIGVDLIGFALFWAVIATFIHLLLIERRHRVFNAMCWTILLVLYIPFGRFVERLSGDVSFYEFRQYPHEIIVESQPTFGGVPYSIYSEGTTYLGGFIYRKLESVEITDDDLTIYFPRKYKEIKPGMDYFIWESKGLVFNFEDQRVYPAVKK